jgi:AraC-like DNA-binding protein
MSAPASPLRIERHSSELGRWEMIHRDAHPRFGGHIRDYCGWWEDCPGNFRRLERPSRDIAVILSFGPDMRVLDPEDPRGRPDRVTSFVVGMYESAALTEHDGRGHGIEIRLSPPAAHRLLGLPMHEFTQRVVDWEAAMGRPGEELIDRLAHAPSWDARFDMLDAFFASRLEVAPPTTPGAAWAWSRLEQTSGGAGIGGLAEELGWSHKRLIARFREQIGLRPKAAARVLRFDRVAHLLERERPADLGRLALDAGYYDQAHFNRDFRAFAGLTPSEFLARRLPDGGGISGA